MRPVILILNRILIFDVKSNSILIHTFNYITKMKNKRSGAKKDIKSDEHNLNNSGENTSRLRNENPFNTYEKIPYFFKEEYINESNAFTKYYEAIKKNGYILNIIKQVENMGDYCDLFCEVSKDYNGPINMVCDPVSEVPLTNRDILYASNKLKLIDTPNKGRCLIADNDIPKNYILIHEYPTILQVKPLCLCVGDKENSLYRCHNCGLACKIFYTCDGCNICIFCSRSCLLSAYKYYHRYECYGLQRHFWSMDDTDYSYLSLRMMLYGTSKQFETDPVVGSGYGDLRNNYPFIYKLETNFDQMSWARINEILYSSAKNLIYLISKTSFFYQFKDKNCNLHDLYLYIGGLLVKHYCQAQTNNVILKYPHWPAGFGLDKISGSAKAICPTIALLNHACSPNAAVLVYSNGIVVRSIRPIKKEEEITICYKEVDPLLTVSERQMITEELFYFVCDCSFCNYERKCMEAPFKCPTCLIGKAKKVRLVNDKEWGHCITCGKFFNIADIDRSLKVAHICKNLYDATQSVEHVTRVAECYSLIFHTNSWFLQDVYKLLCEKYIHLEAKPLEALKYGLLSFNILEHHISRLYLPILVAKVKFIFRILSMSSFINMQVVTDNEFETMRIFLKELMKIKEDLVVYLPEERLTFHHEILLKVHQVFQFMRIQEKK